MRNVTINCSWTIITWRLTSLQHAQRSFSFQPILKLNGASTVPIEPFLPDGSVNSAFVKQSDSGEVLLLKSKYLTNEEKSKIIISGIHKAHDEFLNHPVTQSAIFVLTTVATAGFASSINLGSKALVYARNAYSGISRMTTKQILKQVGKAYIKKKGSQYIIDATRSICYQYSVEQKINFVTVTMDTFIHPYIGEFVGNTFFIGIDFTDEGAKFEANSIFDNGLTFKEFTSLVVKSSIKAFLNGKIGIDGEVGKGFGAFGQIPYDIACITL